MRIIHLNILLSVLIISSYNNYIFSQTSQEEISSGVRRELKLNHEDFKELEKNIINDFKDLEDCIIKICNNYTTVDEAQKTIDYAINFLFVGENSKIMVSKLHGNSNIYPIRQYLVNLVKLPYVRIEFEWYKVDFIKSLRQKQDGKFYGLISITQKFKGFSGDKLIYSDITIKNVQLEVEIKIDAITGIPSYDARILDIGVKETKSLVP